MAAQRHGNHVFRTEGGSTRPEVLEVATGEEPIVDASSTTQDDVHAPNPAGSTRPEGDSVENSRIRLRNHMRVATWNVRNLRSGKLKMVINESKRYNISIMGIAEHRWAGQGHFQPEEGGMFIYSGREQPGIGVVGIYLTDDVANSLLGYNPISDRVLTLKLQGQPANITVIQAYAPTSAALDEDVEQFYESIQQVLDSIPTNDIVILMGDFNAKVGEGFEPGEETTVGGFGLGERNDRGEQLVSFAVANNLSICNTLFKHHKRRRYTWTAPNGTTMNQIDYILVRRTMRSRVRNTRTFPGADCGSDHQLLCLDMKCKVKAKKKCQPVMRFDVSSIPDIFSVEVHNQYEALAAIAEEMSPNDLWEETKEATLTTAKKHLSRRRRKKSEWISEETLNLIEKRRSMKEEGVSIASLEYRNATKDIKRACRKDKRQYLLNKCCSIEAHSKAGNSKAMYGEIKNLTKKFKPSLNVIKNKEGNILTETNDVLDRCKEYCRELYEDEEVEEEAEESPLNWKIKTSEDSRLTPLRSEVDLKL
ncbi:craniofacial development protein 2-like [Diadema antillarum]|uniref:craniofacial development protein 2-like n=1 Tax=Diadema antillarum TaxID=105358 RepID=UPI003A86671F